ncbi:MAG: hypothetical protein ACNA8W_22690, partial [Bradymonadaceae bacterium]
MNPAPSLGDYYEEYLDDELGYRFEAWDVISIEALRRHDVILHAAEPYLANLKSEDLDDLDRWALARARLRQGNVEAYLSWGLEIARSEANHPAIHYPDLTGRILLDHARQGLLDEAADLLASYRERWPELKAQADQLEIGLAILAGDPVLAGSLYARHVESFDNAALTALELAEDAAAAGLLELAMGWLDDARRRATEGKDSA